MKYTVPSSILLAAATTVNAFTDGLLLPSYFCAAPNGNLPYSLGGVLKRLTFDMDIPLAFSANANQNLAPNPPMTGTTPPNTAYMLASIHSTLNSIAPLQNAVSISSTVALAAGAKMPLTISTTDPNNALDGTLIFAETQAGTRVGSFADAGGHMAAFSGCGTNADGTPMGMVHTQLLNDTGSTYAGLTLTAPTTLVAGDIVAIHGLAVQDGGFGFFCTQFTVGSATGTPCTVVPETGVVTLATATGTTATGTGTSTAGAGAAAKVVTPTGTGNTLTYNAGAMITVTLTIPANEAVAVATLA
ncbi:hypothetical protein HDU83_006347 [Entophlyctis luteolus]|nr:hypothetical protein HDU83_006347 [Entophlyctis luteolus]KAJ3392742.1 hypothetical protein HDU84_003479 [Entophlyctis sp. JEL0112]